MEDKIEIPPGADMKTVFIAWLLKQGYQTILTLAFAAFFAFKTQQLEIRLDNCQNAKVDEMAASANAVINAVEVLIGRIDQLQMQATVPYRKPKMLKQ